MEASPFADITLIPGQTLQNQLHHHLTEKIKSGLLPPGTRLPSSRRIATELGVSRNTVIMVMDQLKADGFVESRLGNGIFINKELPSEGIGLNKIDWHNNANLPVLSVFGQSLKQALLETPCPGLPFTPGLPDITAFPDKIWLKIQRRHQDRKALKGFHDNQGYAPLREALAHYLTISRGVRCESDQIIITNGAQQALTLCTWVLLNEGDSVLMENPGYGGARNAFKARNIQIHPVEVTRNGLNINRLPKNPTTKLMYTTPTHQYPLGGVLSATQRLKLLDWASQRKHWIIEDDYDSEFHFYSKPIAALQGMAKQTPVIYVGSFSKSLFPSLRLGYLVVPKPLVSTFVKAKIYQSGDSPLLSQAIVADFILEGHFVRHLRRMRHLYQKKWEHTEALVNKHLKDLATPIAESAGMHLVIKTNNVNDKRLEAQFLEAGFGGSALTKYYNPSDSPAIQGLVLGFANTLSRHRECGIQVLKKLLSTAHLKTRKHS